MPGKLRRTKYLERPNLPLLMLHGRERLMAQFRPILHAAGVTEQQWRIIRVLLEVKRLEPREIGESCRLSSPSLAGVLARMEQLRLITRTRWPTDQRRLHVALTPECRRLARRIAPQIESVYRRVDRLLGEKLSSDLSAMLDAVILKLRPLKSGREADPPSHENYADPAED